MLIAVQGNSESLRRALSVESTIPQQKRMSNKWHISLTHRTNALPPPLCLIRSIIKCDDEKLLLQGALMLPVLANLSMVFLGVWCKVYDFMSNTNVFSFLVLDQTWNHIQIGYEHYEKYKTIVALREPI